MEVPFKGRFCGGNCAGTFDLLIKSEGDVLRHFDLHFLGGQKLTFRRGRNMKTVNGGGGGGGRGVDKKWNGPLSTNLLLQVTTNTL